MQLPIIKCYTGHTTENSFYVLNKGNNAGKPMRKPCPNCFIVTSCSVDESEYWYWLTWGLFTANCFHQYLIGSVIPFIRIHDFQLVLIETGHNAISDRPTFNKALKTMQDIEKYEQLTKHKLDILSQAKIAIFNKILKRV